MEKSNLKKIVKFCVCLISLSFTISDAVIYVKQSEDVTDIYSKYLHDKVWVNDAIVSYPLIYYNAFTADGFANHEWTLKAYHNYYLVNLYGTAGTSFNTTQENCLLAYESYTRSMYDDMDTIDAKLQNLGEYSPIIAILVLVTQILLGLKKFMQADKRDTSALTIASLTITFYEYASNSFAALADFQTCYTQNLSYAFKVRNDTLILAGISLFLAFSFFILIKTCIAPNYHRDVKKNCFSRIIYLWAITAYLLILYGIIAAYNFATNFKGFQLQLQWNWILSMVSQISSSIVVVFINISDYGRIRNEETS